MSNFRVSVTDGNNINLLIDRGTIGPTGPSGSTGPSGPTGPIGAGLTLSGSVSSPATLPASGQVGDQYFVQSTQTVYIWSTT